MRAKLYHFLVNKHPGIKTRYHRVHDNSTGIKKVLSWLYLLWLNFAYYILCCHFLGREVKQAIYEEKNISHRFPESSLSGNLAAYMEKLSGYEYISFDIFDTLIFRPFSEPTDLFYFLGQKLGYMDFKRIRMEAEARTRYEKFEKSKSFEVTLKEIWKRLEKDTGIPANKGMQLEQELELQFCYANPFMLKIFRKLLEQGKTIVIVSDMYLPADFLQRLLEEKGFSGFKKLYVSCELDKNKGSGELFSYVKKDLQLDDKAIIHVGDNEHSDVKRAKQQGFASCYYPNVNKNTLLYRPYDMSPIIGGAYRGLVNNHLYCGLYKHTMEYEFGYIYGGLFVVGYCAFIHEYCKTHQVEKILFLSRDGDILKQVYEKLYPGENIEYVYWSRKAATKLMASSDRYDYFRRFLYHKVNQGIPLEKIFESMELEPLLKQLPRSLDRKEELTASNVKKVKAFLLKYWPQVLACYEKEQEAAKRYYKNVLAGQKKAVAVDIGWAGSGAITLNHLVNRVWNLSCEVVGIVAGTNTVHNAEPDASETFFQSGKLVSYLYSFSANRDLMKKHDLNKNYNVYWELLLSSTTRQFVGFAWEDEKKQRVKLRFGQVDANQQGIREIQSGILQFADEYIRHFGDVPYMFHISGRDAYAPMLVAASNNEKYLKAMEQRFHLVVGVE